MKVHDAVAEAARLAAELHAAKAENDRLRAGQEMRHWIEMKGQVRTVLTNFGGDRTRTVVVVEVDWPRERKFPAACDEVSVLFPRSCRG